MRGPISWQRKLPGTFSASFLFAVSGRLVMYVALSKGRSVLAYSFDGEPAWTHNFSPHDHNRFFPFASRVYLDGRRVIALDVQSGLVVAEREFPDEMTGQLACDLGPVYWRGAMTDAGAQVGLDPDTLKPVWEWPDPNGVVRRTWYGRSDQERPYHLVRLPDLLEVKVAPGLLPHASGRDVIYSPPLGFWCAFGSRIAAAVLLPAGAPAWRREENVDGCHRVVWSTADRAYAGVSSLSAYDLSDGSMKWRRPFSEPIDPQGSGTSTTGYVTTGQRTLHRIDLRSGETTGHFEARNEIVGIAAIDDSRVAIATHDVLMCIAFN